VDNPGQFGALDFFIILEDQSKHELVDSDALPNVLREFWVSGASVDDSQITFFREILLSFL